MIGVHTARLAATKFGAIIVHGNIVGECGRSTAGESYISNVISVMDFVSELLTSWSHGNSSWISAAPERNC